MKHALLFLVPFVVSFQAGWPVHRLLHRFGIVDCPNQRSSHSRPTVRGGGLATMLAVLLGGIALARKPGLALVALLSLALLLAVLSFWDDLRPLPWAVRFGGHALAAVGVLYALNWPRFSLVLTGQPAHAWPALVSGLFLLLWLTGYTNAFNFMDGINGLAAGQTVVTGLGMALLCSLASSPPSVPLSSALCPPSSVLDPPLLLSLVIAGAALGFLPHNFPKARMFMGDVGSVPLGFLLAALAIWLARDFGWWLLVPLALLHTNFVLDTSITLARRVARGERWYEAHREHFYQRLVRAGKSHAFVTGWEMGLQLVGLGLMVAYVLHGVLVRVAAIVLIAVIWLVFFAYCELSYRRASQAPARPGRGGDGQITAGR